MMDAQHGWGVGQIAGDSNDLILFTQDGGITWKNVTPVQAPGPAGSTNKRPETFFLDASQAWIIYHDQAPQPGSGQFTVWHTADGGRS